MSTLKLIRDVKTLTDDLMKLGDAFQLLEKRVSDMETKRKGGRPKKDGNDD